MSSRPRPRPRLATSVALVALVAGTAVAGCDSGDGRALADPAPGATAPVRPTGSTTSTTVGLGTTPVGSEDAAALILGSPAFGAGAAIPARYSCDGDNVSPPLGWTGIPDGTVELALTVVDPSAPGGRFVHWVVAGVSPTLTGLDEDAVPDGAVEARNGTSEFGWFGPCPPAGETHSYVFTLFALARPSGVAPGTSGDEAIARIATTQGSATTLTATYGG